MALYHEAFQGTRPPAPYEAPSLPTSGVILGNDPSSFQAMDMGFHSGVTLTEQEVDLYAQLRGRPANGEPLKSDQRLMAEEVLAGGKRALFESAFPNIFPLHVEKGLVEIPESRQGSLQGR